MKEKKIKLKRKFGWKPNLPDHRDKKLFQMNIMDILPLPPLMDLRSRMSPIEDQGHLSSCVANATAGALEFLELEEIAAGIPGVETFPDNKYNCMSRLYIYYNARSLDEDTDQDAGTSLRSAVQAIQKWGICRESIWAYDPSQVFTPPPSSAYLEGATHMVLNHYTLDNSVINELKQCLAIGLPFIFGMSIYDSFMSDEAAESGMIPIPDMSEDLLGGHALCCVGYDDSKNGGSFIVRNSWGADWGDNGYCYIPYSYLTDSDLASDFWALRKE